MQWILMIFPDDFPSCTPPLNGKSEGRRNLQCSSETNSFPFYPAWRLMWTDRLCASLIRPFVFIRGFRFRCSWIIQDRVLRLGLRSGRTLVSLYEDSRWRAVASLSRVLPLLAGVNRRSFLDPERISHERTRTGLDAFSAIVFGLPVWLVRFTFQQLFHILMMAKGFV